MSSGDLVLEAYTLCNLWQRLAPHLQDGGLARAKSANKTDLDRKGALSVTEIKLGYG